jgi:hypothetical protein
MPSSTSARMFRSVWLTIVPSTTGSPSRGRPMRRATIIARAGSPRRAGSVADISTPIIVPCSASRRRGLGATGIAARRIADHDTARTAIDVHISASATSTHETVACSSEWPIRSSPMRFSAKNEPARIATATSAMITRRAKARIGRALRPRDGCGGSIDGRRRAGRRGCRSADRKPVRVAARRTTDPDGAPTAIASS